VRLVSALLGGEYGQKESWTMDELVAESGLRRTVIQRAVREMRVRGLRVDEFTDDGGKARKNHPMQYRLVSESVSAHTHGGMGQNESESRR
jgi:hypothetical protein